jgi:hypothetical protein
MGIPSQSPAYLWLTYKYAHVGMLVCTHIMLVCTRRPSRVQEVRACIRRSFFEAGNGEGIQKSPYQGGTATFL